MVLDEYMKAARELAPELMATRARLAGKAQDVERVHTALDTTATSIAGYRDDHTKHVENVTQNWQGDNHGGFDTRARRTTHSLHVTSASAADAAKVVLSVFDSVTTNHNQVHRVVDEYTRETADLLRTAVAANQQGAQGSLHTAVAAILDRIQARTYEAAGYLDATKHELTTAAHKLGTLTEHVQDDGVVDPSAKKSAKDTGGREHEPKHHRKKPHDDPKTHSARVGKIRELAKSQIGYHEGAGNQNKYGPTGPWCSNFATWVWQRSGVKIPILPFTGDVYDWGVQHHLAYGKDHLGNAKPGDVLLFGTGPQNADTSTHIGIVDRVEGNKVWLIEGNSGDRVQTNGPYTLSSSTFYGGVHPG